MAVNAFEIFAKVMLDNEDFKKKLDDSESKMSKFAGAIKSGLGTITKVSIAGFGAAAAAVASLTKASVESYADYEQLVGGVETLFGAGGKSIEEYAESVGKSVGKAQKEYDKLMKSQNIVMENAEKAYITAGLSTNEYMETVTSFSASLLQSLGGDTEKAAKVADRAIIDMSDNANKMGTSMEAIQNAYNGFAKANYTMLDNLKLGYGGTKEEMARLVKDAAKMKDVQKELGVTVDANSMSFGNIVNAISVMQKSMGIAGTTAKEAASTISGSAGMMKASWSNLVTGIADDNADFSSLIANFVTSVTTFADNIIPRVQTALSGVGDLVVGLAPLIGEQLPVLVSMILPAVIDGAMSIISALGDALPTLIMALSRAVVEISRNLSAMLKNGFEDSGSLNEIMKATETLINVLGKFLIKNAPLLIDATVDLLLKFADFIKGNTKIVVDSAIKIISALSTGLMNSLPQLVPAVVEIVLGIAEALISKENIGALLVSAEELAIAFIGGLWEGIKSLGSWFSNKIKGWFGDTVDEVKKDQEIHSPSKLWARLIGKPIGQGVGEGAVEGLDESEKKIVFKFNTMSEKVLEKVEKLAKKIKDKLSEIQSFFDATSDIAELEYELWEMTEGANAKETEKLAKKMELLNKQLSSQKEIVNANNEAYNEMVKLYGEGSVQAMEYKKQLMQEQVEYQKLQNELAETDKAYKDLQETQNIWQRMAVDAVRSVKSALNESTKETSSAAAEQQKKSNDELNNSIAELTNLFKTGKAKTNISNARELRGVSYG